MKFAHTLSLALSAGLLLAGPSQAQDTRTITLRFRRAGDTAVVRNAQITVDHTMEATTDSNGVARIADVEDGGHIVEAAAKGYQGYFDNFATGPGIRMPIELELQPLVEVAKPKGEATGLALSGFDKRRVAGTGKFFTLAQLKAASGRPLSNFLKVDASAYIASGSHSESFLASRALSRAGAPCYAAVVRDGLRIYPFEGASPPDLDKTFTDDLAGVELYAGAAPSGTGTGLKCGALVLWSRP